MKMDQEKSIRAGLIIIGDEILSGRTQDANLSYLANWLNEQGVVLAETRVIPDQEDVIVATVNEMRATFDYVFTTGGIGPTHDDITAKALARAFGVPLTVHPEAKALLVAYYGEEGVTEARLKMATMPEGTRLVPNRVSGAPGFRYENVFVLAGIPGVMQAMLEALRDEVKGTRPVISGAITVFVAESAISEMLAEIQKLAPEVSIGSYPFYRKGQGGACLVVRSRDAVAVENTLDAIRQALGAMGLDWQEGEPRFPGEESDPES